MSRTATENLTPALLVAVHTVGFLMAVLVVVWVVCFRGGLSYSFPLVFNWHPILMLVGFVLLLGEGALVFRMSARNISRGNAKVLHWAMQGIALLLAILGIAAAFKFHNDALPPIPNLYSLHSWSGILVFILVALQFVYGLYAFLVPCTPLPIRRTALPWHTFLGAFLLILAMATASQGLVEKMAFATALGGVGKRSPEALLVNVLGLLLFLWGGLLILLATRLDKERRDEEGGAGYMGIPLSEG